MSKIAKNNLKQAKVRGLVGTDGKLKAGANTAEWSTLQEIAQRQFGVNPVNGAKVYATEQNHLCHNYIYIDNKWLRIEKALGEGSFGYVKLVSDQQGTKFVVKITDEQTLPPPLKGREEMWLKKFKQFHGEAVRQKDPTKALFTDRSSGRVLTFYRQLVGAVNPENGERYYVDSTGRPNFSEAYKIPKTKFMSVKHYAVQKLAGGVEVEKIINGRAGIYLDQAGKERMCKAIAKAVASAHKAGAVHRDLKPENIFYDHKKDKATLIDLGIMAHIGEADMAAGTPGFMHPEVQQAVMGGIAPALRPGIFVRDALKPARAMGAPLVEVSTKHDYHAVYEIMKRAGVTNRARQHELAKEAHKEVHLNAQQARPVLTSQPLRGAPALNAQMSAVKPIESSRPLRAGPAKPVGGVVGAVPPYLVQRQDAKAARQPVAARFSQEPRVVAATPWRVVPNIKVSMEHNAPNAARFVNRCSPIMLPALAQRLAQPSPRRYVVCNDSNCSQSSRPPSLTSSHDLNASFGGVSRPVGFYRNACAQPAVAYATPWRAVEPLKIAAAPGA